MHDLRFVLIVGGAGLKDALPIKPLSLQCSHSPLTRVVNFAIKFGFVYL